MTALFDLGAPANGAGGVSDTERAQRVLDEAKADHAFGVALDHAVLLGGRDGLRRLKRYTAKIAAVESKILEEFVQDDGNTRRAERALDDGRTSKKEQRKKASRARAVGKNPDLATKLADQELSEEQLDVIADASTKTDGAAANDTELIDKVAAAPPEQGKTIVDKYLADRATADGIQTEHNRQRALRRAFKYNSKKDGLDTIAIAGDGVASKAMWDAIDKRADEIYKRDGNRDLPATSHPRTRDQRLFDAAHEIICGITTTPTGQTQPEPVTNPHGAIGQETGPGVQSKRYTPSKKSSTTARPQIVIALTVDKLLGRDPAAVALQHGLGLIPDSVLADYAAHADIIAALFDRNGEPLWLGRLKRYATPTQHIALILRDRGCVLCGADPSKCQAHHSMPWNAPGKGQTNLDELVLLCGPCHHQLHTDVHTIYQDQQGTWRTRPATPDEIPPNRPDTTRNTIRLE